MRAVNTDRVYYSDEDLSLAVEDIENEFPTKNWLTLSAENA